MYKELVAKFPKIFSRVKYFECKEGWSEIIYDMCHLIQYVVDTDPLCEQVVAIQVKEKFGSLRFYYYGGNARVRNLVEAYSHKTKTICEVCGSEGTMLKEDYWLRVRCDKHKDK